MIDLHMHTTYSDGTDTVKELLEKVENLRLEVYARNLIQEGYKIHDVYDIMEYDIPLPRLQAIAKELENKKEVGESR